MRHELEIGFIPRWKFTAFCSVPQKSDNWNLVKEFKYQSSRFSKHQNAHYVRQQQKWLLWFYDKRAPDNVCIIMSWITWSVSVIWAIRLDRNQMLWFWCDQCSHWTNRLFTIIGIRHTYTSIHKWTKPFFLYSKCDHVQNQRKKPPTKKFSDWIELRPTANYKLWTTVFISFWFIINMDFVVRFNL